MPVHIPVQIDTDVAHVQKPTEASARTGPAARRSPQCEAQLKAWDRTKTLQAGLRGPVAGFGIRWWVDRTGPNKVGQPTLDTKSCFYSPVQEVEGRRRRIRALRRTGSREHSFTRTDPPSRRTTREREPKLPRNPSSGLDRTRTRRWRYIPADGRQGACPLRLFTTRSGCRLPV